MLTTDNTILFDRLTRRGYNKKKVQENVQCEIMQVCVESMITLTTDFVHVVVRIFHFI